MLPRLVASEDPKRGAAARSQQPIKMTPTAFNVLIINKAKGKYIFLRIKADPGWLNELGSCREARVAQ